MRRRVNWEQFRERRLNLKKRQGLVGEGISSTKFLVIFNTFPVRRTSPGFEKPSLKRSTSFRVISSNQKLARALTCAPKAIARTNSSMLLDNSWDKHRGLIQFSKVGCPHPHSGQTQKSNVTSGFRRLELCKNLKENLRVFFRKNVTKVVL